MITNQAIIVHKRPKGENENSYRHIATFNKEKHIHFSKLYLYSTCLTQDKTTGLIRIICNKRNKDICKVDKKCGILQTICDYVYLRSNLCCFWVTKIMSAIKVDSISIIYHRTKSCFTPSDVFSVCSRVVRLLSSTSISEQIAFCFIKWNCSNWSGMCINCCWKPHQIMKVQVDKIKHTYNPIRL